MYFSKEKLLKYKPLISLLSHTNKLYAYMQLTPILMAITCAYKDKVETHVLWEVSREVLSIREKQCHFIYQLRLTS